MYKWCSAYPYGFQTRDLKLIKFRKKIETVVYLLSMLVQLTWITTRCRVLVSTGLQSSNSYRQWCTHRPSRCHASLPNNAQAPEGSKVVPHRKLRRRVQGVKRKNSPSHKIALAFDQNLHPFSWSLQPRSPTRKHLAQPIDIYCILYELLDLKGKHKDECNFALAKV